MLVSNSVLFSVHILALVFFDNFSLMHVLPLIFILKSIIFGMFS
jgi:hypothetical protein